MERHEMKENSTYVKSKKTRITGKLCLAVVGAVLGSFQFGFNTGVINAPEESIKDFLNETDYHRTGSFMSQNSITNMFAVIVSMFAVGGCLGGILAGWWAEKFGRKFGFLLNAVPGIIGSVLMYFSVLAKSYEMVIVGRLVIGFNCGLYTGLTPLYLSEISTPDIRGALGVLHQLGVTFGILFSQILGFPEVLGNADYWNLLLGLAIFPCLFQLVVLPFCPESPRYLLISKQKEDEAKSALVYLQGTSEVDNDVHEMKQEARAQNQEEKVNIVKLLTSSHTAPRPMSVRITGKLCLAVVGAVLGSFQFGFNTGVINAPEESIKDFLNATDYHRTGSFMSQNSITNMFAVIVSMFAVGGCLGGILAGWWAEKFGRKFGFLLNAVPGIIGSILMYFSVLAKSYEMVIVGRLVIGFNCGLYTGLTPLYLSEISTPDIRGALGVLHQFRGLAIFPCLFQLVVLPFCPESPRYLLISKQKEDEAKSALVYLQGTSEVDSDVHEMKQEARAQSQEEKVNIVKLLTSSAFRRPLIISVVMQLSQQLSGINGVFYYSANLFKSSGLSPRTATHATSGVGGVMVVMTFVTIFLMDRAGRRTLHLIGLAGMFVFSILMTITLALRDEVEWFTGASIAVSLLYVVFFAVGPGSVPWLIVAELFSQGPRSAAMSISVLINWMSNFLVGYSFPHLKDALNDFTFLPFTGLLLLFWIFTFLFVPETKNKTFEQVTALWKPNGGKKNVETEESHLVSYNKS
ncbi:Solute carrier 2, facilitated glucose transporter member 1 [Bulinus truncatus]|nr:Solute carrier 2, facilitated glucose transporter member 1 [Bulinus truncatus]